MKRNTSKYLFIYNIGKLTTVRRCTYLTYTYVTYLPYLLLRFSDRLRWLLLLLLLFHVKWKSFCLQLIFSGEFTKAMNKDWHSTHFCCWQCDESLTGQRYVLRDDHPYCIKCYESVFANPCEECNKIIGIDSKVRLRLHDATFVRQRRSPT